MAASDGRSAAGRGELNRPLSNLYRIGIDVGGTFTDVVGIASDGTQTLAKAASTPADQSLGVVEGLRNLATALDLPLEALLRQTERIVHGTTVATNALLERKGAEVWLLTTEGHRDVIEMREGLKPERYDLRLPPAEPLVPRHRRLGVKERLRPDGSVAVPLDQASLDAAIATMKSAGAEAVAIGFLHAWRDAKHEHAAAAAVLAALPGATVTCSADVLPQIKEFERFSTTAVNAYVGPVVSRYLARLAGRLEEAGYPGPLFVILSHGGVAPVAEAARLAVGTALSGPAGGVAAAVALAQQGMGQDLVTFDMGGTSTDIALVVGGEAALGRGRTVGGERIALESLDIVTLGAEMGDRADRHGCKSGAGLPGSWRLPRWSEAAGSGGGAGSGRAAGDQARHHAGGLRHRHPCPGQCPHGGWRAAGDGAARCRPAGFGAAVLRRRGRPACDGGGAGVGAGAGDGATVCRRALGLGDAAYRPALRIGTERHRGRRHPRGCRGSDAVRHAGTRRPRPHGRLVPGRGRGPAQRRHALRRAGLRDRGAAGWNRLGGTGSGRTVAGGLPCPAPGAVYL
ncbi:MAG: hydantoinase/oxoprolinase family protein [Acetobacteraceae bacterium]|nr:MAG: hydantoinase/oxoprolinase family protein [Acetobacteraceae bacterium]